MEEKFMLMSFGIRLGIAMENGDYDHAARLLNKSVKYRAKKTGRSVEDEQEEMIRTFDEDDDQRYRNLAAIYKQKYMCAD